MVLQLSSKEEKEYWCNLYKYRMKENQDFSQFLQWIYISSAKFGTISINAIEEKTKYNTTKGKSDIRHSSADSVFKSLEQSKSSLVKDNGKGGNKAGICDTINHLIEQNNYTNLYIQSIDKQPKN